MQRLLWLILGHCFVVLGIIGAFLPIIPTIPFIVIASACYSKGSEKFHQRLRAHHWFGSAVRDWEDRRAVSLRSKLIILGSLATSLSLALLFLSTPWVKAIMLVLAFLVAWFIWTRPTAK